MSLKDLLKKDFIEPDPDDGGQMRYEMSLHKPEYNLADIWDQFAVLSQWTDTIKRLLEAKK